MIFVVDACKRRQFVAELEAMHCHRKAVFVDRAGWKVPVVGHKEIDRYDFLEETVYLLAKDDPAGSLRASARLLTTTGLHLMRDLYSAAYRAAIPSGPTVWEVSRYCTAPGIGSRARRLELLWEIVCGLMETALERGIDQVIFAANQALLPLALDCGWEAQTVGPTMTDGNDQVTAVVAAITPSGLRNVRDRHRVPESIIRVRADTSPGECPADSAIAPDSISLDGY